MTVGREAVDDAARRGRAIEVDDLNGSVVNLERRCVREDDELHHRHDQRLREQDAVAHDVQHFGLRQKQNPPHGYSSRSWKDRTLAASSTVASIAMYSVSRQRYSRPMPLSMMPRAIPTNHLPGKMNEIHCRSAGMLSTGKMNPDNSTFGSSVVRNTPIIASR